MKNLNSGGWNISDDQANYGAYIIDHINYFKDLNFKDESDSQIEKLFVQLQYEKSI